MHPARAPYPPLAGAQVLPAQRLHRVPYLANRRLQARDRRRASELAHTRPGAHHPRHGDADEGLEEVPGLLHALLLPRRNQHNRPRTHQPQRVCRHAALRPHKDGAETEGQPVRGVQDTRRGEAHHREIQATGWLPLHFQLARPFPQDPREVRVQ